MDTPHGMASSGNSPKPRQISLAQPLRESSVNREWNWGRGKKKETNHGRRGEQAQYVLHQGWEMIRNQLGRAGSEREDGIETG